MGVAVTSLNTTVTGVLETANQHATMNETNTALRISAWVGVEEGPVRLAGVEQ